MNARKLRPAHGALAALGLGVLAWDFLCPRDETLTAGVADLKARRPLMVTTAVVVTAGHLLGAWPRRVDPFVAIGMTRRLVGR